MAKYLNSQSLLEWQTYPDHSSVPPSKLQGLLLQYIEDRKHQFSANWLYSSHLYGSDSLQGQYAFYVCEPDKNSESEANNPFTLLRTMVTFLSEDSCSPSLPGRCSHRFFFFFIVCSERLLWLSLAAYHQVPLLHIFNAPCTLFHSTYHNLQFCI